MVWKKVAEKGSIPKGASDEFNLDGKQIVVINHDGLHAMDSSCAHQNQSIACGKIDGDVIECPHHFWHYNYKTGELLDYLQEIRLKTYDIKEDSKGIHVDL